MTRTLEQPADKAAIKENTRTERAFISGSPCVQQSADIRYEHRFDPINSPGSQI
jgi:hypothetical protein